MTAIPHAGWVHAVLRRLPATLLQPLDTWSRGLAKKSAERRRQKAMRRAVQK
ncbi:hypothetical protein [Caenimonas koreensis]|uniref:Uncharacterized protein n=1 Tax=Caenimonas koreensis DSM 17982 TaxID=1121255 RepID=A0A844B609_9BURK|nr:hypothetical protein [Caenimonas koreensis]MRD46776.1 hypothetical protein [Caenimonas koreensis DSM 17982]